ncbi:hypothetical protein CPB86DRAFT_780999 [Serendipita vermifera]|nr:hypothetical protein CPB86DRAFT_780999 [Serendipita vermifera]
MVTEGTLKTGEKVFVNDYVYSAAPWEKRDPVPYSIGRIIEFIPAEEPGPPPTNKWEMMRKRETGLRVRVAWFYRPTDVQDKGVGDHRLLLAALFSEIISFTNIRGKCIVRHRDKISDLTAYKKKDDHFYFHQLFDPFTKDNYEVILANEIHNLPSQIKDVLVSRYEFVVCEREALQDLQDNLRLCETCGDWCPGPESVMCELCKKHYHMECVTPPLLSKPSRGYGWSCASCNNKRENNDLEVTTGKNRQNKDLQIAAMKARMKVKANTKIDEEEDKYWKGWSFRYFGQYTVAEDTLDPDDMIYVRAPTRIGKQFQTAVPETPMGPSTDPDIPVRGEDETVELMSAVVDMTEQQMGEVERRKSILTPRMDLQQNVDWIEEVIRRFSEAWVNKQSFYSVNMRKPLCVRKWKDGKEQRYRDKDWSEIEEQIFDESVRKHHSELRHVRSDLKTRTMPEIVRHFGHWKTEQLRVLRLTPPDEPVVTTAKDENTSIYQKNDRRVYICAVCRTRESELWWKAPRNLPTNALCDDCGMLWRKYAIKSARGTEKEKDYLTRVQNQHSQFGTPEPPTTRSGASGAKLAAEKAKREGTPLQAPTSKRLKGASGTVTPSRLTCSLCRKSGPQGQVVKCVKCGFTIHSGCVGVPSEEATPDWTCEICSNEQSLESNLDTKCLLCPPHPAERKKGARDSAFFRAAKPTEFRGWVHVLCSTFNHPLEYTDARRMRLVEGIVGIPPRNFTQKCGCCGGSDGCISQCDQCLSTFHPVCAWNHGFKFGIEFSPIKPHGRRDFPTVEFRGEVGTMSAVILCDNHNTYAKKTYDLCDLDEKGRTALQVFTETFKQAHNSERTYGLLRKARRLDEVVTAPRFDAMPLMDPSALPDTDNQCIYCSTEISPFWWPTDALNRTSLLDGEEDVKMVNGDAHTPKKDAENSSSPAPMDLTTTDEEEAVKKKLTPKICHACYFTRLQDKSQPIRLDLSTPIPVI